MSADPVARYDCPSAQPEMEGARPFGVISGTATETRIAFFKKDALEGFDWRAQFSSRESTRMLRFAARCEEGACGHFNGATCSLGNRVKSGLPAVVDGLPSCLIRPSCRWHAEQGSEVCMRCPQVVTSIQSTDGVLDQIAAVR